jgi:hypothetical protein
MDAGASEAVEAAVAVAVAEAFVVQQGTSGASVEVTVAVAGFVVGKAGREDLGIVRRVGFVLAVACEPPGKGVDARGTAVQPVRNAMRLDGGQCKVAFAEAFGRSQISALR